MVLRVDAVEVRLQRLEAVVSELERLSRIDPGEIRRDTSRMWGVERGLQLGAEILFDVGSHILVAEYGVSPQEYKEILTRLANQDVISRQLADRLEGLAGFRNILVHDYLELDPDKVLEALKQAPEDFSDFARDIQAWLEPRR
jgi:uncharacterized protein YutE (UPF0331/DUF86 family)